MNQRYDATWVEGFYDDYGAEEWDRLTKDPAAEVKLHVHRHYLTKYIRAGDRVLEIGPGPGRFTQALADIGAKVVAADISGVQLDLHRQYAREHDFERAVEQRVKLDMCDMGELAPESFDVVVCYGGPLSYVFEQRHQAVAEVVRVLRPGGVALFSVMTLWGVTQRHLDEILGLPPEVVRAVLRTGDVHPETYPDGDHQCHMFRADELRQLLHAAGAEVLELSASNCLSAAWYGQLAEVRHDPQRWELLLEMELQAGRESGSVDFGEHTIAVARKPKAGQRRPDNRTEGGESNG
ncbi:MAG: class I SAM-dependent methyltransferase [Planctomycetota bacterium]|jgi:SAM-dependent methyltransferase